MQQQVFNDNASNLDYLKIDNSSKTAIVLFHGYGASMSDLYGLGQYIQTDEKADWIFPNGNLSLEMMGMAQARAWFPIDAQALEAAMMSGTFRDFESVDTPEFKQAVDVCIRFITSLKSEYDRIIVGGFSQGAMISTHACLDVSELVSGLICLSGTLINKEKLIGRLESVNKFSFFQSHGKQDPILPYNSAKQLFELLKLGSHQGEFISFDGAHEIPEVVLLKLQKYINTVMLKG